MTDEEKERIRKALKEGEEVISVINYVNPSTQLGILSGYRTAVRIVEAHLDAPSSE